MQLVRFDPFSAMREFDRLFEGRPTNQWLPRVDVFDREADLMIRTEVAGVSPEDIEITVEGNALTIRGARSFEAQENKDNYHRKEIFEGSFERTVLLPEGTDPEAVKATSKDGILEISVPKKPEVLPRKVAVEVQR
jgi:HSP20 family protein